MSALIWACLTLLLALPQADREPVRVLTSRDLANLLTEAARRDPEELDALVKAERPRISRAHHAVLLDAVRARQSESDRDGDEKIETAHSIALAYQRVTGSSVLCERSSIFAGWNGEQAVQRIRIEAARTEARQAGVKGELERTVERLEEGIADLKVLRDRLAAARVVLQMAELRYQQGRHQDGAIMAREACVFFEAEEDDVGVVESLIEQARLDLALNRHSEAEASATPAEALAGTLNHPPLEGEALEQLGAVHHYQGRPEGVVHANRRALEIYRDLGDRGGEVRTLNNMGTACIQLGRYQEAARALHLSVSIKTEMGDRISAALSLMNLGIVYGFLGDHERALDCYLRSKDVLDKAGSPLDRRKVRLLHNIAICRQRMGEAREALEDFRQLLGLRRSLKDRRGEAVTHYKLGQILMELGRAAEAREELDEALAIYESLGHRLGAIDAMNALATLCRRDGDRASALEFLDRAVAMARSLGAAPKEAVSLAEMGHIHFLEEEHAAAVDCYESSFALMEAMGIGITAPALKIGLASEAEEGAVSYLHAVYELDREEPGAGHWQRAFTWLEKWKSRALLDALGEDRRLLTRKADRADLEREKDLLGRISRESARMRDLEPRSPERKEIEERVKRLTFEVDEVREKIALSCPGYASLTSGESFGPAAIQKEGLDSETLLLEYRVGKGASYLFALTDRDFKVLRLPSVEVFDGKVRYLRRLLEHPASDALPPGEFLDIAGELYEILVAPALQDPDLDRPSLVIVPDNVLAFLPFEALVAGSGKGGQRRAPRSFSKARFLLLEKRILYSPSAAAYVQLLHKRRAGEERRPEDEGVAVLAMANPAAAPGALGEPEPGTAPTSTGLPEIPAAVIEVQAIANLFPQCDLFLDAAATEEVLKAPGGLDRHRIVHIAAHGLLHAENPRLSGLALASDPLGREDGVLMMIEVLGLAVDADLVVLSGCRTALGKRLAGEGVIGFPWAFLYAGARSVVVSLWAVNDASTASLMTAFYENLVRRGLDKAESLRQAKIALFRGRYPAPKHWAPFILIGEGGGL